MSNVAYIKEYLKSGDFVLSSHNEASIIFIMERKEKVIKVYYIDDCDPYFYNIDDFFDSALGEYKTLTTAKAYELIIDEENRLKHEIVKANETIQAEERKLVLSKKLAKEYKADYKSFTASMSNWENNINFRS